MQLRKVAGCSKGECPAVYLSDRETVVFQGTVAEGVQLGAGEQAVELPLGLVLSAIPSLPGGH
jgi:hypothetical protein